MSATEDVVEALLAEELVVLPTDTVYGLACLATSEEAARSLYRLKGRDAIQPTAVIFASVEALLAELPELEEPYAGVLRAVLPGPYTLVLPNPCHRFRWLNATRPDAVGVRVPGLPPATADVLARVGAIVATSANLPGEPDPRRLGDVPPRIRDGVAAAVDGGDLPGTPSTVVDATGAAPVVLRHGAGDVDAVLEALAPAGG